MRSTVNSYILDNLKYEHGGVVYYLGKTLGNYIYIKPRELYTRRINFKVYCIRCSIYRSIDWKLYGKGRE